MIDPELFRWNDDFSAFEFSGLRFVEAQQPNSSPDLIPGKNCFVFHKMKPLVDEYIDYFGNRVRDDRFHNVIELGLFEGGSVPFWFELLRPERQVGVDIQAKADSPYFDEYLDSRGLRDRIHTYWRTDQADGKRLLRICRERFGDAPIDLVIDDASHFYEETLASFETLFPLLRPGGLFLIEDWAWFHWRGIETDWNDRKPLTQLIFEIVEATGTGGGRFIREIHARPGFAAIYRGDAPPEEWNDFAVEQSIYRHPR